MKSIKEIYKIGYGPSSSHTMGPGRAAQHFKEKNPDAELYRITLYSSLALTGKGHCTDDAIHKIIRRPKDTEIIWEPQKALPRHPNGMLFEALKGGVITDSWKVYSTGGGSLWDESGTFDTKDVYPNVKMNDILDWCRAEGRSMAEYVEIHEGIEIYDYLKEVWQVMLDAIHRGIETEGVLPGTLKLARKAASYYIRAQQSAGTLRHMGTLFAASLAVAEENAGGGLVVTAPTCGASGVVPSVLYFLKLDQNISDNRILRGLATAGLIGNIVKSNGSISGAEVG